jgi:hypothetical protein
MTPINILKISYNGIVLLGIVLFLLTGAFSLLAPQLTFGVQIASASSQYGILGQQPPSWNSTRGSMGVEIRQIRLS